MLISAANANKPASAAALLPVLTTRTLAWPPLTAALAGARAAVFELKLALTTALEHAFSPTSATTQHGRSHAPF